MKATKSAAEMLKRENKAVEACCNHESYAEQVEYFLLEIGAPDDMREQVKAIRSFIHRQRLRHEDNARWMTEPKAEPFQL